MYRFITSLKKEYLLLINDRVGLLFMFVMPFLLVILLSVIQDSAFRKINDNRISLLIVNHDKLEPAQQLVELIRQSGMFNIIEDNTVPREKIKTSLIEMNKMAAIYIPVDFSSKLKEKADNHSELLLADMMQLENPVIPLRLKMPRIEYYHDPILQESYNYTFINVLYSYINIIENTLLLNSVYEQMELKQKPDKLKEALISDKVIISQTPASETNIIPNSTQHNVPAWTIFAMFFMVVSLGSNIVKERLNGSFTRLKTIPVTFSLIFGSKLLLYVAAALIQSVFIFSVGVFLFPFMGLPELTIPSQWGSLILVVLIAAVSAVSYALMIGSLAKTQEQANGIGAVSVVIFAAMGGILVPVFVMPDIMKLLTNFSPLHWCLESFYLVFLRGGSFINLLLKISPLIGFITICLTVSYFQLKKEKVI